MNVARFRNFVEAFTRRVRESEKDETRLFDQTKTLLRDLVLHEGWLPGEFTASNEEWYQQYLLYCDPWERFSVVSFAWNPGQSTPVSDLQVWGMMGVMDGDLTLQNYSRQSGEYALMPGNTHRLNRGDVHLLTRANNIFKLSNASTEGVAISIHIFGANIAKVKRYVYDVETGTRKKFYSSYSNPQVIRSTHTSLKVLLERIREA